MNTPAPSLNTPAGTPQTAPTAFGLLQSLATGWLTYKASTYLGLGPNEAIVLAGGVTSAVTSGIHKLAQKWHLEDVSK